jgi:hypothetical protein
VYIWPCGLGCLAERWIHLLVSVRQKTDFPLGFWLCFAPFHFFFVLKNSPVLNNYNHAHNMMQPRLCLKIWRVILSNVFYWICPKHTVHSESIQTPWLIPHLLHYSLILKPVEAGWMGSMLHSYFHISPEMFDWVHVRALAGPLKDIETCPEATPVLSWLCA